MGDYIQDLQEQARNPKPASEFEKDPNLKDTDLGSSALPYHTAETEKIAEERAAEVADQPEKPYEYKRNGYTVTEVDSQVIKGAKQYKIISAQDASFEHYEDNKRAAEIYVETHAPLIAGETNVPAHEPAAVVKNAEGVPDEPVVEEKVEE